MSCQAGTTNVSEKTERRPWTKDELRLCAIVYRRAGALYAASALKLSGWERTPSAIRDKMRKIGVTHEPLD
jgi:hypothetical protein